MENTNGMAEINLVKQTCQELGINQKELAEKIGVSRQTIYDWSNQRTPLPKWALTIFELLFINKKYFELKSVLENTFKDKSTNIFI